MATEVYGRSLNFYSWKNKTLQQVINLGDEGIAPLEIRFLHDPKSSEGYVGCAVKSTVYRFYKKEDGTWTADQVIKVPAKKVDGWMAPYMFGDEFSFFSASVI